MFFNPESCRNETEVESKFIVQYLLPALGYTPEAWHQEVSLGSVRLDFLVFAAQLLPIKLGSHSPLSLVIEAKSPKVSLIPHISKLKKYLTELSAPYGVLTNGKDFIIFSQSGEALNLIYRCKGRDVESKLAEIKALIGYSEMRQRRQSQTSTAVHEAAYTQNSPTATEDIHTKKKINSGEATKYPQEKKKNTKDSVQFSTTFSVPSTSFTPTSLGATSMKTIAVYHNKGGVGKTTTVINLAAAFSKLGKRVLIIDLDSQANTTFAAGLIQFEDENHDDLKSNNVLHLLSSEETLPINDVARTAHFCMPEVDVIPSHIDLMGAESELNSLDYSRMVLAKKLSDAEENYDITLIDTPPSLNLYARIALIAADYLIIPSDLKPFANQGLTNVKRLINDVNGFRKLLLKSPVEVLGVLATKVSTNSKFKQSTLPKRIQTIADQYGFGVMDSIIFERDDLAKCSEKTDIKNGIEIPTPQSVFDFKPNSMAAQEFHDLAQEVLNRIG